MNIGEAEVNFRKRYWELFQSDEELLRRIGVVLDGQADEIIDAFYEHLLSFPETKAFLRDEKTIKRVKEFQKAYFKRLTKGGYDLKYFQDRLKIGMAHDRIKMPLKLYVGAYNKYHQIVIPKICKGLGYEDCSATLPVAAFSKIIFLDMSLAIDAYIASWGKAVRESEERYRTLVTSSSECICNLDLEGNFVFMNPAGLLVHGKSEDEVNGKHCTKLVKPAYTGVLRETLEKAKRGETVRFQYEIDTPQGSRWLESILTPIKDESGDIVSLLRISRDITEHKKDEEKLSMRARQQAAVVELSKRALAYADFAKLLNEAVRLVATTLDVKYSKVLELLPDGNALLLRAGVGWKDGFVGHTTVSAGTDSQAGYTLLSGEPVIVEDLRKETRFSGPPLLTEHGVISGLSVIISSEKRPYGILGAHTTQQRTFTQDDINFLQAVANVLTMANERWRAAEELKKHVEELEEFHRVAVGRELKMVELKDEIKKLKKRIEELEPGRG